MAKVDWKKLKHAQGPATRVPQQIQDLAKPGHPSDAASFQLTEALVVEGKWLATSVPAAELLVEQCTKKGAKPAPAELRLLGDLAAGDHLWFLTPEAPAKRAKDKVAQATLAIARAAIPLAVKWLSAAEPERRAVAVFFLALVEEDAASGTAIAEIARKDKAPEVRGGAALALGFYARTGNAAAKAALVALKGDGFVTAGRWAGHVIAGMPTAAEETTAAVSAWFVRWEPALLPWGRSQPLRLVTALARVLPNSEALAPVLVRAAALLGPNAEETRLLCNLAVDLAGFTTSFKELEVVPAASLSPVQRATAEALIALPGPLLGMRYGLPGSSQATERWLGLAPPGPLERAEKDGIPRWQHVRALYGKKKPSAAVVIAESLKGLSPAEQLEVATELLLGAYKILIEIDARITPSALAELARAAGKDAVPWAKRVATLAADMYSRGWTTYQLSPSHLMMVLGLLVDAGVPIESAWEPLISIDSSSESRKMLASLPEARREQLVLSRLAKLEGKYDDIKADYLDAIAPLLEVVGSTKVVKALRALLKSGEVEDMVAPETVKLLHSRS